MAKQREGVYERIIECARKEFLEKGYMDASLRTIATQAGTTTGSIYTRFKDKEGLFEAIVGPHYDHIMSRFCQVQEEFAALPAEQQPENMGKVSGNVCWKFCSTAMNTWKNARCSSARRRALDTRTFLMSWSRSKVKRHTSICRFWKIWEIRHHRFLQDWNTSLSRECSIHT